MYLRGEISILVPAVFSEMVAILTAPAVYRLNSARGLKRQSTPFTSHDCWIALKGSSPILDLHSSVFVGI